MIFDGAKRTYTYTEEEYRELQSPIRTLMAGAAMMGLLASGKVDANEVATDAVFFADAVIKEVNATRKETK